jgi:hypothetical protein
MYGAADLIHDAISRKGEHLAIYNTRDREAMSQFHTSLRVGSDDSLPFRFTMHGLANFRRSTSLLFVKCILQKINLTVLISRAIDNLSCASLKLNKI